MSVLAMSWFSANEVLIQNILIAALLAFSVQISLRSGVFSVASVGTFAIGSYTAALLVKDGTPVIIAMVAVVVGSALISWLLARLLVRLKDLYLAMATFAFVLMVQVVVSNWVSLTGGPVGVYGIPVAITTVTVLIVAIVVALLLTLLERGAMGRTLDVIREDDDLAQSFAIDTRRYKQFIFVLAGVIGGITGAFSALMFNAITPEGGGFDKIVLVLTIVVLGGRGSWIGALIGAIVLTWVPLELQAIGQWWNIVYGALLIAVAAYAPAGLLGFIQAAWRWIRSRTRDKDGPSARLVGATAGSPAGSMVEDRS